MRRVSISRAEARRIALAAQGFDRCRPASADDRRHFRRAMAAINVLQLDFVNVLVPAHFLMIWSRLGAYDRDRFEDYLYGSGEYTEQWAHEASVVSVSDWPLLAHRRKRFRPWKNSPIQRMPDRESYLKNALQTVQARGAITANELPAVERPKGKPGDWHRPVSRWALEYHFGKGNLAVSRRQKNFQRLYDLPERVIDDRHRQRGIAEADAERELLSKASCSLGIATAHDIADYYRMNVRDAEPRLQELVEDGELYRVAVEGWQSPAFLSSQARSPRQIEGASILSPFDPLVWFRPRALRLFDFEYRIEIYVPAAKRRWGYYVLPFREGDRLTARVDLKADREAGVLRVRQAHLEPGAEPGDTAAALARELKALAAWLELESLRIEKASAFEKALATATQTAD